MDYKHVTLYITDRNTITEDELNDEFGKHYACGELVDRVVFNQKCVDYINSHWLIKIPVYKTKTCKCCGSEVEELIKYDETSPKIGKKKGQLHIYESDYNTVEIALGN